LPDGDQGACSQASNPQEADSTAGRGTGKWGGGICRVRYSVQIGPCLSKQKEEIMNDWIPFGFISQEAVPYIVHNGAVDTLSSGREWEQYMASCPFDASEFWREVAECLEKDKEYRQKHKLVKNDFFCPVSVLANLVRELVCRDIIEEDIVLLMDQRVYRSLAYHVALEYWDIGTHYAAMMGQQALLLEGAYIRVGFSKFLPTVQFEPCNDIQTQIVAVTSLQVVNFVLPSWCQSGRYNIHLK